MGSTSETKPGNLKLQNPEKIQMRILELICVEVLERIFWQEESPYGQIHSKEVHLELPSCQCVNHRLLIMGLL